MRFKERGLFLGFTNLPLSKEDAITRRDSLSDLIKSYRTRVEQGADFAKNIQGTFHSDLYNPSFWCVFGSFDLLAISEIDGFNFALQHFIASEYELHGGEEEDSPLFRHTVIGAQLDQGTIDVEKCDLIGPFSRPLELSPLIGVIHIKFSEWFLEAGVDALTLASGIIRERVIQSISSEDGFSARMQFGFSWSEINLILTCDAWLQIDQILHQLRTITLYDIIAYCDRVGLDLPKGLRGWESKESLNMSISKTTSSTLGARFDLFFNENSEERPGFPGNVYPLIRWSIIPGYVDRVRDFLRPIWSTKDDDPKGKYVVIGREDLIYPEPSLQLSGGLGVGEFFDKMNKTFEELDDRNPGILRIETSMVLKSEFENEATKSDPDELFGYHREVFETFNFPASEIRHIRRKLDELLQYRMHRHGIISAFNIFNNRLKDVLEWSNFIDLYFPLRELADVILAWDSKAKDKEHLRDLIKKIVDAFNFANINRLHSSYKTSMVYDSNLHYAGGINNALIALSGLYRTAASLITKENNCFVLISGAGAFLAHEFYLKLNYHHLFHVEAIASNVYAEVAHQSVGASAGDSFPSEDHGYTFQFHRKNLNSTRNDSEFIEKCVKTILQKNSRGVIIDRKWKLLGDKFMFVLRPEFLEHVFNDVVSLLVLYKDIEEYFDIWYWGWCYSQKSEEFDLFRSRQGMEYSLHHSDIFIDFLMRRLILESCFDVKLNVEFVINNFTKGRLARKEMAGLISEAREFCNVLFAEGTIFEEWLKEHVEPYVNNQYGSNTRFAYQDLSWIEDELFDQGRPISRRRYYEFLKSAGICDFSESFEKMSEDDRMTITQSFLCSLIRAYLKGVSDHFVLEQNDKADEGQLNLQDVRIMIRRSNAIKNERLDSGHTICNDEYSNFCFDPLGSTMIWGASARAQLYKVKMSLLWSFWGIQKEYESERINNYINQKNEG